METFAWLQNNSSTAKKGRKNVYKLANVSRVSRRKFKCFMWLGKRTSRSEPRTFREEITCCLELSSEPFPTSNAKHNNFFDRESKKALSFRSSPTSHNRVPSTIRVVALRPTLTCSWTFSIRLGSPQRNCHRSSMFVHFFCLLKYRTKTSKAS